jgi:hypothetical protein
VSLISLIFDQPHLISRLTANRWVSLSNHYGLEISIPKTAIDPLHVSAGRRFLDIRSAGSACRPVLPGTPPREGLENHITSLNFSISHLISASSLPLWVDMVPL